MEIINEKDLHVTCELTKEKKEKIIHAILDFFITHKAFHAESVMQCDNPQIEAPVTMAEICEIIDFKVEYK